MMKVRGKGLSVKGSGILGLFGTVALLASVAIGYSADLTLGDPRTMTFKPVEFSPPEPERVVLVSRYYASRK